jgi:hypothetical protein
MKQIKCFTIIFFSCFSFHLFSQPVTPAMLGQLDKAEKDMFAATSNGDTSAFRKISSPEYFSLNADGVSQNLDEALAMMNRFKGATSVLSEQKQRLFGNVALRTGRAKFYFGQQQVAEVLYTSGWVYENNAWHFIHWQGTPTGMMLENKGMKEPPKN